MYNTYNTNQISDSELKNSKNNLYIYKVFLLLFCMCIHMYTCIYMFVCARVLLYMIHISMKVFHAINLSFAT